MTFTPQAGLGQGVDHVQVQRLAGRARLLGAVEHGQRLDGLGKRVDEMLDAERPVQPDLEHADLLARAVR